MVPSEIIVLLIAVVLGGMRISHVTHPAFQAVAHLFIGWLIGSGHYQKKVGQPTGSYKVGSFKIGIAILLSLLELACFLAFKFLHE